MPAQNRNKITPYTPDPFAAWIGFDLDCTLAIYGGNIDGIGDPILPMLNRLKAYLEKGMRVKIFTARADDRREVYKIQKWLVALGVPPLEVTNKKDYQMLYCYDDRARQVVPNMGIVVGE